MQIWFLKGASDELVVSDVAIVGPLCTGPFPGPAGGRLRSGRRQIHAGSLPIAAGSLPMAAGSLPIAAGSLPLKWNLKSIAAGSLPIAAGSLPIAAGLPRGGVQ